VTVPSELTLERAMTIGGIGRSETRELSQVSKEIYATQWRKARAWKRGVLRSSSDTFTPEQVAMYALHLIEQGYARSTAGLAVRAIRWKHRVAGEPVPDGLPASYVLRGGDSTGTDHDAVNDTERPARRDPFELLSALAATCKPATPKGCRDLALLNLVYAGGFDTAQLAALNVGHVMIDRDGRAEPRTTYWLPLLPSLDDGVTLRHTPRPHYGTLCPVCTLGRWLDMLLNVAPRVGDDAPLFRSIDKGGNIAGTFERKGGQSSAAGRLLGRSINPIVLRPRAAEAGLLDVLPHPVKALRLAGAVAAYSAGEVDAAGAAIRAGYQPGSPLMLRELVDLTGPHMTAPTGEDTTK
jgi:integrase